MSAFANTGRAVAHVRGSYVPIVFSNSGSGKLARIAWSVLARDRAFEARKMGQAVNNSA